MGRGTGLSNAGDACGDTAWQPGTPLPAARGAKVSTSDQEAQARILVIDDEAGMREGCKRALSPAGYEVDAAADLASGLELAHSRDYDLFLLDLMLPDGSGLDLIDPLLQRDPNAICIVITGFGTVEMAVAAVRRGAYDFLSKPFTSDELLVAVGQGLERRELKLIEKEALQLAQAKHEWQRLDEIKSQLMLKVAHELRAPVSAVQSYINLIQTGYVTESELKPTLSRVQERLQEMLDLTADLLELSHLKQAKEALTAEASPQRMAQILQETCDLFREQVHEKNQDLQVEIRDHPLIVADQDHMKQIWRNLISNAIKYTPQGGQISVTLHADEEQLVGSVADTGMGIAAEDMPHLFQDFFRTDQAKASGEIGTGLGLSIVKQIVESYGGEIRVTSRLEQGTQFTFVLPLERPAPDPVEAAAAPARRPLPPETPSTAVVLGDKEG
jgi:signal transduction histidine kinase